MIRSLRQRHCGMVCALAALLPVAFAAGIAARRPVPVAASVPPALADPADRFGNLTWTKTDVWPDHRILTNLRRDASGAVAVEFLFRDITKPDVLVYWAAGQAPVREGLPENARLLGAFAHRAPLPLPADARGETGRFVLYSLADHEIVAASMPCVIQRPGVSPP